MHILEVYLESGGFDYRLVKGGISVYLWNLTRAFNAHGHRTSVLSALNGQKDFLSAEHGMVQIDYRHDWDLSIDADPGIWGDLARDPIPLCTRAWRLHKDGTDFYYLSNAFLDRYPDTYYPPYEGKGSDLGFFKPLVFQLEAIRFIRHWFGQERLLIHAHEPFYQYLLPIAFAGDDTKRVISTVQSNMPITKKIYLPELRGALAQIGVDGREIEAAPAPTDTLFCRAMVAYLPRTHLNYPYPPDYVSLFDLVLEQSDRVDFLSEGHLAFYRHFTGTAFRALFLRLPIHDLYRRHGGKLFVGGCGLSESWLGDDYADIDREGEIARLGLDPNLPTFFHSARYAPNHKGQVEMVLAVRRFLEEGGRANFILRCISGSGVPDARFHDLRRAFAENVYFTWEMQTEAELKAMAAAADFALFPSKLEMDTFLIAQGEAMAAGCVPIASDQLGMEHWGHGRGESDPDRRTGFPVIRSFLDEDAQLVDSLVAAIRAAVALHGDRPRYEAMAQRAQDRARTFDWNMVAERHLAAFAQAEESPAQQADVVDPGSDRGDWRATALEQGQLLDLREAGGAVPTLTLENGTLRYGGDGIAAVLALAWSGEAFDTRTAARDLLTSEFVIEGLVTDRVVLLVTLRDGDQFWDGTITTREVP